MKSFFSNDREVAIVKHWQRTGSGDALCLAYERAARRSKALVSFVGLAAACLFTQPDWRVEAAATTGLAATFLYAAERRRYTLFPAANMEATFNKVKQLKQYINFAVKNGSYTYSKGADITHSPVFMAHIKGLKAATWAHVLARTIYFSGPEDEDEFFGDPRSVPERVLGLTPSQTRPEPIHWKFDNCRL